MMVGVIIVGAGLDGSGRVIDHHQGFFLIFGMCTILASVFSACWGYYQTLQQDTNFLLLSREGLSYQSPSEFFSFLWKDLTHISLENHAIILETHTQQYSISSTFLGIKQQPLCLLIKETQRKALLGVFS